MANKCWSQVCSHFGATFSIKAQNLKQYISDKLLSTTKPTTTFAIKHITIVVVTIDYQVAKFLVHISKKIGGKCSIEVLVSTS
jgi:hypothetical protein